MKLFDNWELAYLYFSGRWYPISSTNGVEPINNSFPVRRIRTTFQSLKNTAQPWNTLNNLFPMIPTILRTLEGIYPHWGVIMLLEGIIGRLSTLTSGKEIRNLYNFAIGSKIDIWLQFYRKRPSTGYDYSFAVGQESNQNHRYNRDNNNYGSTMTAAVAALPPLLHSVWWNHRDSGSGAEAYPHLRQYNREGWGQRWRRRVKRQAENTVKTEFLQMQILHEYSQLWEIQVKGLSTEIPSKSWSFYCTKFWWNRKWV